MLNTVMNLSGRHLFLNRVFNVDVLTVRTVDEKYVWDTVRWATKSGKLRIVFSSPTLLRDPFR